MRLKTILKWLLAILLLIIALFMVLVAYFIVTNALNKDSRNSAEQANKQSQIKLTPDNNIALEVKQESTESTNNIPKPQKPSPNIVLTDFKLVIPKINVSGIVSEVGLNTKGEMEAPVGPNGLGWYKFGTYPGGIGSAVIDGHYGRWVSGEGSIFDNLSSLKKGDTVYIEKDSGEIIEFVVRELKVYNPEDDASDVFFSSDGKSHLNLVTCTGTWIGKEKTFSERLVVFTDKK
ncbi:MAG: class F sortase [Candidatus Staskawiczbacteria bacterium]|nr:class F sortase [Candidatus Staskawiczbacteria bacterium]